MTPLFRHFPPVRRSRYAMFILAAALGLALGMLAAPTAQAFTISDQSNTANSDGSAKFANPEAPVTRFNGGGQTTIRQGNAILQFGPQRPVDDQRYNTNRMFDPLGRPGDPDPR